MNAPPDLNHAWRLDRNGRWYYVDRNNMPVFDPRIPRTVPPATNVAPSRPSDPPPNSQYQYRDSGPLRAPNGAQSTSRRAESVPPTSTQLPNTPAGQPVGRNTGRGIGQSSRPGPQPIPIPTAAAQPQAGSGRGRGVSGAGGANYLPGPGYGQAQGVGRGSGQFPVVGSLPSSPPVNPQGLAAGRGRGLPGTGVPQPPPTVTSTQLPGIGRGYDQLPASVPYAPPQPGSTKVLVVGLGRGGPQSPPPAGYAQQSGGGRGGGQPTAGGLYSLPQPTNTQLTAVGHRSGNAAGAALPTQQQAAGSQSGDPRRQKLIATPEQRETLDEDFKVRTQKRKFFKLGKVFLALHTENFGQSSGAGPSTLNTFNNDVFVVAYGELVFTKVRRFIVVREHLDSCSALAITTHSGRGASQRNASEHGVVYTGAAPPPERFRDEPGILPTAIRIDPSDGEDTLHSASRVHYAKVYTIEHNVKVKPYGVVNNQFMHALITQWTQVFIGRSENLAQLAFRSPSQQTLRDLGFSPGQITSVNNILTRRGASPYNAITSIARASAEVQLGAEDRREFAVRRYANHVVDLILAGMTYPNAVSHVKLLAANEEQNDDDHADDDEEEEEDEEENDD